MKITKQQLKKIIQEDIAEILDILRAGGSSY